MATHSVACNPHNSPTATHKKIPNLSTVEPKLLKRRVPIYSYQTTSSTTPQSKQQGEKKVSKEILKWEPATKRDAPRGTPWRPECSTYSSLLLLPPRPPPLLRRRRRVRRWRRRSSRSWCGGLRSGGERRRSRRRPPSTPATAVAIIPFPPSLYKYCFDSYSNFWWDKMTFFSKYVIVTW